MERPKAELLRTSESFLAAGRQQAGSAAHNKGKAVPWMTSDLPSSMSSFCVKSSPPSRSFCASVALLIHPLCLGRCYERFQLTNNKREHVCASKRQTGRSRRQSPWKTCAKSLAPTDHRSRRSTRTLEICQATTDATTATSTR